LFSLPPTIFLVPDSFVALRSPLPVTKLDSLQRVSRPRLFSLPLTIFFLPAPFVALRSPPLLEFLTMLSDSSARDGEKSGPFAIHAINFPKPNKDFQRCLPMRRQCSIRVAWISLRLREETGFLDANRWGLSQSTRLSTHDLLNGGQRHVGLHHSWFDVSSWLWVLAFNVGRVKSIGFVHS